MLKFLPFLGPRSHPREPIGMKFCMAKRTHVPVGCAKFHVNQCNWSSRRVKILIFDLSVTVLTQRKKWTQLTAPQIHRHKLSWRRRDDVTTWRRRRRRLRLWLVCTHWESWDRVRKQSRRCLSCWVPPRQPGLRCRCVSGSNTAGHTGCSTDAAAGTSCCWRTSLNNTQHLHLHQLLNHTPNTSPLLQSLCVWHT